MDAQVLAGLATYTLGRDEVLEGQRVRNETVGRLRATTGLKLQVLQQVAADSLSSSSQSSQLSSDSVRALLLTASLGSLRHDVPAAQLQNLRSQERL